jgi:hypothetical protein
MNILIQSLEFCPDVKRTFIFLFRFGGWGVNCGVFGGIKKCIQSFGGETELKERERKKYEKKREILVT